MAKFKIGDLVIYNGNVYKIENCCKINPHGWVYLLNDHNWYFEDDLVLKEETNYG